MTDAESYLIRYDYPGTINGKPVGRVYLTGPLFGGSGIFSHTYDPSDPTVARFPTVAHASREISRGYWPNASVIPASEAEALSAPDVAVETDLAFSGKMPDGTSVNVRKRNNGYVLFVGGWRINTYVKRENAVRRARDIISKPDKEG